MWWVVSGSWVGRPEDRTEKMNRDSSQGTQEQVQVGPGAYIPDGKGAQGSRRELWVLKSSQGILKSPRADTSSLFIKEVLGCWVLCHWITFLPDLTSQ